MHMHPSLPLFLITLISATLPVSVTGGSSVCSNSTDFQHRISKALHPDTGRPTPYLNSLRGTIDNVLTAEDTQFLLDAISPTKYKTGSGYDSSNYGAHADAIKQSSSLAGLELSQLANPRTGFATKEQYERYLDIRERIRKTTEDQLGLCPGTLRIHFSHLSQKGKGGKHNPHADNCFHRFDDRIKVPQCDPSLPHPFPNRIAASIVFINDNFSYGGGQFYWADLQTGDPAILVTPKAGRMTYFTAGPENLHGALPVEGIAEHSSDSQECIGSEAVESGGCSLQEPRRIYLAFWYVDDSQTGEVVPSYRDGDADISEDAAMNDPNAPTKVLQIPVESIRIGGLKLALSFFLLAMQNEPTKGTWRFVQQEDVPLGMVFKDESAMFSVSLSSDAVIVLRHTDYGKKPSLLYQLQESVALHNVLDELHSLAFGTGDDEQAIRDEDRLLILKDEDGIEKARNALPARSLK